MGEGKSASLPNIHEKRSPTLSHTEADGSHLSHYSASHACLPENTSALKSNGSLVEEHAEGCFTTNKIGHALAYTICFWTVVLTSQICKASINQYSYSSYFA